MLKAAFNSLTRLHSRAATLKRLGTPDFYTPIHVTPSNYFRFLRGPEYTTVKGVEFVIPQDTAVGHFAQKLIFSKVPDAGAFKLTFGGPATTSLSFNATAAAIQTAVRLISGLEFILVTGDFTLGFVFTFPGFSSAPTMGVVTDNTLLNGASSIIASWTRLYTPWDKLLLKGDIIIDGNRRWAVDEIVDMHDVGATIMGWRVRCD